MRINLFKANEARDKAVKELLHKRNKFITRNEAVSY